MLVVDIVFGDLIKLGNGFRELFGVEQRVASLGEELIGSAGANRGSKREVFFPEGLEERV